MEIKHMKTGNLTPRTNKEIKSVRYSGGFGQPEGFASVLTVSVRQDGRASLTLMYDAENQKMWTVELTHEQRVHLASWLGEYEPILHEEVKVG